MVTVPHILSDAVDEIEDRRFSRPSCRFEWSDSMPLESARAPDNGKTVELFEYEAINETLVPTWEAFNLGVIHDCDACGDDDLALTVRPESQPRVGNTTSEANSDALKSSFENGRIRGLEEGRAAERELAAAILKARETRWSEQSASLFKSFDEERKQYFESAERAVVQLALAVASRILRRESQMDPLLLSGAVRVALGQLSSATQVRLRVPAADLELWRQTITHLPNLNLKPMIVIDETMQLGDCALECELGSINLGVESQLREIERVLFDGTVPDFPSSKAIAVEEDMSE